MTAATVDGFALRLVDAYREHLSPRKKFHCAAGVAGHGTCSTVVRDSIQRDGIVGAVKPTMQQFATCFQSARQLRAEEQMLANQAGFGGPGGGPMGGPGGPMGGPGGFGGGFGGPMRPRRRAGVQGVFCCGPIPIPFRF